MSAKAETHHENVGSSQLLEKYPSEHFIGRVYYLLLDFISLLKAGLYFGVDAMKSRVRLRQKIWLSHGSKGLHLGKRIVFHPGPKGSELTIYPNAKLTIGDDCMVNYGFQFIATKSITIGSRVRFGIDVVILDNSLHGLHPSRRHIMPKARPVVIEDDVWICSRAMIMPGVRIGRGSVVAAGSVVTKDVPPYTVVGGQPAAFLRHITATEQTMSL